MRRFTTEAKLGAFILIVAGLLAYAAVRLGALDAGRSITVYALFEDVSGLVEQAAVRISGVTAGKVERLDLADGEARATLRLRAELKIPSGVRPIIKAKSLLGEKYVDLDWTGIPKGPPYLKDGDVLAQGQSYISVDDVIKSAYPFFKALRPDELKPMVDDLRFISGSFATVMRRHQGDIGKSLDDMTNIIRALDKNTANITSTLDGVNAFLKVFTERDQQIGLLLDRTTALSERLPQMMEQLTLLTKKLPQTLDNLDKALNGERRLWLKVDLFGPPNTPEAQREEHRKGF